jgi:hypothetical protein
MGIYRQRDRRLDGLRDRARVGRRRALVEANTVMGNGEPGSAVGGICAAGSGNRLRLNATGGNGEVDLRDDGRLPRQPLARQYVRDPVPGLHRLTFRRLRQAGSDAW